MQLTSKIQTPIAHLDSSNAYNLAIFKQKHQVWIGIFGLEQEEYFGTKQFRFAEIFRFCIFSTSHFSEWGNAFNLCYVTSSNIFEVTCLALWRWINFF